MPKQFTSRLWIPESASYETVWTNLANTCMRMPRPIKNWPTYEMSTIDCKSGPRWNSGRSKSRLYSSESRSGVTQCPYSEVGEKSTVTDSVVSAISAISGWDGNSYR